MKKKKTLIIILASLIAIVGTVAALLFTGKISFEKPVVDEPIIEEIPVEEPKQPERELWLKNKAINNDYLGEIVFDSGLINKSFVQAKDVYDADGNLYHFYTERGSLVTNPDGYTGNDVYIWTNWQDMTYDYNILGGSVFMDYRNYINDQNIIIYGHHFSEAAGNDPERCKAFTPLEKLLDEANYKDNKTCKLILDNETRYYELVATYKYDAYSEYYYTNLQYYRTNYNYDEFNDKVDNNYYKNYIDAIESVKLYPTDAKLTTNDRTLTLQTCISGLTGQVFEVCVFKETSVEKFN